MRNRAAEILEATVREFILTGLPVSSSHLYERYDFGIKPASIRIELTDLTDEGFLEQPHHAAGHVPSDRGYEYYALRALEDPAPSRGFRGMADAVRASAYDDLADLLAEQVGAVGVVADLDRGYAVTRGLPALVERLDWESREELAGILRDIEGIDERIARFGAKIGTDPRPYIGSRSPFGGHGALAAIAARYSLHGRPVAIIAVGPKRMDYDRAATLFAALQDLSEAD